GRSSVPAGAVQRRFETGGKHEIRSTKSETSTKFKARMMEGARLACFCDLSLVLWICLGFGASDFGFEGSPSQGKTRFIPASSAGAFDSPVEASPAARAAELRKQQGSSPRLRGLRTRRRAADVLPRSQPSDPSPPAGCRRAG